MRFAPERRACDCVFKLVRTFLRRWRVTSPSLHLPTPPPAVHQPHGHHALVTMYATMKWCFRSSGTRLRVLGLLRWLLCRSYLQTSSSFLEFFATSYTHNEATTSLLQCMQRWNDNFDWLEGDFKDWDGFWVLLRPQFPTATTKLSRCRNEEIDYFDQMEGGLDDWEWFWVVALLLTLASHSFLQPLRSYRKCA